MEKEHYYLFRRYLDCVTFLQHLVKVDTPKGLVPWKMDGYQKNLVRDYSRNRAINKSKKTGISTTLAGEALHHAYTMPGRQKALVSTGQRIAGELLGKFYDEYDTIPFPLQVNLGGHRSAERVEFPNKARIFSLPSGDPDKIRGLGLRGTATDVVLDEFAFAPNDKQLWLVIRDFQRFGGRITINSTPKGKRGKYYEICAPLQAVYRGAPYQPTEWSYHEIHFTRCKRLRDQEKSLKEDIDEIEFNEEYCVLPGTIILTDNGLKKIEEISIGDKVLTHTGEYKTVTKTFVREINEDITNIKTYYSTPELCLTSNHKLLCVKRPKTSRLDLPDKEYICKNKVEWIEANNIEQGDFLVYPKKNYKIKDIDNIKLTDFIDSNLFLSWFDPKMGELLYCKPYNYDVNQKYRYNKFPRRFTKNEIPVNDDLMTLIGYYLAEGYSSSSHVEFSFHIKEVEYQEEVKTAIRNLFGIEPKVIYSKHFNCMRIYVDRKALGMFFEQFGKDCYTKKIPEWIMNLPKEKKRPMVRAMFNGDGCYFNNGERVGYCTVSDEMRIQLRDILLEFNIISSIVGEKSLNCSVAEEFYEKILLKPYPLVKQNRGVKGWVNENYLFLPVKFNKTISYSGKVYNLEVEEDNSYVCYSHTVHNCCEFVDESMSFFPYEMIWAAQKVERYIDNGGDKPIYFGIDFGKSVGETVVIVVEEYDTEKFRVIWIEPMGGIDYTEQLEAIKQLSETYNPICINVDASGPGGQTIYDFLQKEESLASKVWGFNFDPKFKEKIIIRTRMLMSRGRLLLPVKNLQWSEVLETQLHQVQRKTTMSGEGTRYTGKVEGRNDDYAWSLALAVWKEFMLEQKEIFFSSQPDEGLKIIENAGKGGSLWV